MCRIVRLVWGTLPQALEESGEGKFHLAAQLESPAQRLN
jgi:hypothetical protein